MGGVPARVSVGFTDGSYDISTHRWLVSDVDAHAWVEAWFPHYGWVRFDPTPNVDPALRDLAPETTGLIGGSQNRSRLALRHRDQGSATARATRHRSHRVRTAATSQTTLIVLLAVLVTLLLASAPLTRARRGADHVAELARAFARTGRRLDESATLAGLERRLASDWPQAAAYVRALRLARFAPTSDPPSLSQHRALRAALGHGLGVTGRLRALWALPPRWSRLAPWPGRPLHTHAGGSRGGGGRA
jgi:hypothetical protein